MKSTQVIFLFAVVLAVVASEIASADFLERFRKNKEVQKEASNEGPCVEQTVEADCDFCCRSNEGFKSGTIRNSKTNNPSCGCITVDIWARLDGSDPAWRKF